MVATSTEPRLLTWTVATPRGLWHRAIVIIERGLFITPDLDTNSMNELKEAADSDLKEMIDLLTGHGRFKRASFLTWASITGLRHDPAVGTIEIDTEAGTKTVKVADRQRLQKLARVLAATTAAYKEITA